MFNANPEMEAIYKAIEETEEVPSVPIIPNLEDGDQFAVAVDLDPAKRFEGKDIPEMAEDVGVAFAEVEMK